MKHLTIFTTACFLTVALVMTSGCSQSVPPESDAETVASTEQPTTQDIIIAEMLAENPELAPFVNDDGTFNVREAASALYETSDIAAEEALARAEQMGREWHRAYVLKSQEVITRV